MNTFKKKSLYAALAGVSALGATGAAQAVSVNPDGLGQALIYPYYTVRDKVAGAPFVSLLSVVNSTQSAKAVKVRFLEGKNSREVLDFNLYLSRKDVWVAAITPTATGAGIYTPDLSCTTPEVSNSAATPTLFVNFAYTGSASDGADPSLDRTREGYVEIIEMGDIAPGSNTEEVVTHVAGVPPCDDFSTASADTVPGSGGLFGNMTLINVLAGEDYGTEATALEGFSSIALWFTPGSVDPQLALVNPKTSVVTTGTSTYRDRLGRDARCGEPGLRGADAQPRLQRVQRRDGHQVGHRLGGDDADEALLHRDFDDDQQQHRPPVPAQLRRQQRLLRRRHRHPVRPRRAHDLHAGGLLAAGADVVGSAICWEANVITFNNTNVFASKNIANISTTFQNGWLDLEFPLVTTSAGVRASPGGRCIERLQFVDRAPRPTLSADDVQRPAGDRLRCDLVQQQLAPRSWTVRASSSRSTAVRSTTRRPAIMGRWNADADKQVHRSMHHEGREAIPALFLHAHRSRGQVARVAFAVHSPVTTAGQSHRGPNRRMTNA